MTNQNEIERRPERRRVFSVHLLATAFLTVAALVLTFMLAVSSLDLPLKAGVFVGMVAIFLTALAGLQVRQTRARRVRREPERPTATNNEISPSVESGLKAINEAGEFFAGSLKASETFRLVSSRVHDLIPFDSIVLYLLDPTRTELRVAETDGSSDAERDRTLSFDEGLAGQCYMNKRIEVDGYLALDDEQEFGSTVALPLCNGSEVFGVLQMYFGSDFDSENIEHSLYEAISVRVAPLILTSLAFERSNENAMTDVTTDLPNERAFYLILENQIAEAFRKREERPLTILAIDIRNFDELNQRFGHAAGDRVLNFAANVIKDNLRQMDFLSRSIGDEFLAILPTASKDIAHDVIARIHTGFFGRKLKINDEEAVELELNIGWASFGSDGETPGQLLSLAQLRKEQAKAMVTNNVLWFPQESVH